MTGPFRGLTVIITGGGTGIGAASARRFAREGADVVLVGRRAEPLEAVAGEIGGLALTADLTRLEEAERVVTATLARFGRADVVVANAGGHGFATIGETDEDAWRAALDGNLTTAFTIVRASLPSLIASRGAIVVVSSVAGLAASPGTAGYVVGKTALLGLTRSLARDYSRQGVRVNTVCPGWVRTPMSDAEMDEFAGQTGLDNREDAYAQVTRDVPLGRAADPDEIANVICFLASSEASFVTGATLVADGGGHVVDVPTLAYDQLNHTA